MGFLDSESAQIILLFLGIAISTMAIAGLLFDKSFGNTGLNVFLFIVFLVGLTLVILVYKRDDKSVIT